MNDETEKTVHDWRDQQQHTEPSDRPHPETDAQQPPELAFDPTKPALQRTRYRIDIGLHPLAAEAAANHLPWSELPRVFHSWSEIEDAVLRLLKLYFDQNSEVAIKIRRVKR